MGSQGWKQEHAAPLATSTMAETSQGRAELAGASCRLLGVGALCGVKATGSQMLTFKIIV